MNTKDKNYTIINIYKTDVNKASIMITSSSEERVLGFKTNIAIGNISIERIESFMDNELYDLYKSLYVTDFKNGLVGYIPSETGKKEYYILSSEIMTPKFQQMALCRYIIDRSLILGSVRRVKNKIKQLYNS